MIQITSVQQFETARQALDALSPATTEIKEITEAGETVLTIEELNAKAEGETPKVDEPMESQN